MALFLSDEFQKDYGKIKDAATKERLKKALVGLLENPEKGKNLHYDLKGKRSLRADPFRIIYQLVGPDIHVLKLGNRKNVYE